MGEFSALAGLFGNQPLDFSVDSTPVDPREQERQRLMAVLSEALNLPDPEERKPLSKGQALGGSVADALVSYARGRGANIAPQDTIRRLQEFRQQQADLQNQTNRAEAIAGHQARQTGARAGLQDLNRQEAAEVSAQRRAEDVEFRQSESAARQEEAGLARDFRKEMFDREASLRRDLAGARASNKKAVDDLSNRVLLGEVTIDITNLRRDLDKNGLGDRTAEEITEDFMLALGVKGLSKENELAAIEQFKAQIGPLIYPTGDDGGSTGDELEPGISGAVARGLRSIGVEVDPVFPRGHVSKAAARGAALTDQIANAAVRGAGDRSANFGERADTLDPLANVLGSRRDDRDRRVQGVVDSEQPESLQALASMLGAQRMERLRSLMEQGMAIDEAFGTIIMDERSSGL